MKRFIAVILAVITIFVFSVSTFAEIPSANAQYYGVIASKTGQILGGSDVEKKIDPSGLSTLAVAYLYITKAPSLDKQIEIDFSSENSDFDDIEDDVIGLKSGDVVTASDLLTSVFAAGYPDAAKALANDLYPSDGQQRVVSDLNALFAEMGLTNTNFTNIYGTYSGEHYTSISDYLKFLSKAFENNTFKTFFTSTQKQITVNGKSRKITRSYEQTDASGDYYYRDAVCGLKVHHLENSERSLIAVAEKDGTTLIAMLINADNDDVYDGAEDLFKFGFDGFSYVSVSPDKIPSKTVDISANKEYAKIFFEHTVDIYLNNEIGIDDLLYHIELPEDFGKENPTANLVISQNFEDYQYGTLGVYPMTVSFETYNSVVPQGQSQDNGKISALDIIIIIVIILLIVGVLGVFWFKFRREKQKQKRARFKKMQKLENRSLNPDDLREKRKKANLQRDYSEVLGEENLGKNEEFEDPKPAEKIRRTGTNAGISAAKKVSAYVRNEEGFHGKKAPSKTLIITNEDGDEFSADEIFEKNEEVLRRGRKRRESFDKVVFDEDGNYLTEEQLLGKNANISHKKDGYRTGTAENIAVAKERSEKERNESRKDRVLLDRTTVFSMDGEKLNRETVDEINRKAHQKKSTVARTEFMTPEKRDNENSDGLVIKEIKNPDGTVKRTLIPEFEDDED